METRERNYIANIQKMANKNQIPDFLSVAETLKKDLRLHVKIYCLHWFDDSFQNQGFTDASFTAWDKRKEPDTRPGGAILVNTTFLRKSIRVMSENDTSITFGTNAPYASIHNYGGRVRAIQYVRAHHKTKNGKRYQVKAHSRKIDTVFPQRKFIGESQLMLKNIDQWVLQEIIKRFNK